MTTIITGRTNVRGVAAVAFIGIAAGQGGVCCRDCVPIQEDEIPVFWACGVTPQVIATVKPEFCITHYPGSMLVTDRKNVELAVM